MDVMVVSGELINAMATVNNTQAIVTPKLPKRVVRLLLIHLITFVYKNGFNRDFLFAHTSCEINII